LSATFTEDEEALDYTEESSEDEKEIYEVGTRSGRKYAPYRRDKKVEFEKEQEPVQQNARIKKNEGLNRAREKKRLLNKCNRCGEVGHFGTECPRVLQHAVCTRCGKIGHEWNKCPQYPIEKKIRIKKKQFEVEEQWKDAYDFVKHILKNLPKVNIEELMKHIPDYERKVYEAVKKSGEVVNYLGKDGRPRCTPVLCETNIQGIDVEAVVDSGASVTVITRGLAEQLPYDWKPSRTRLIPFGEGKHASLGVIEDMEFFVGDSKTRAKVEVVDLPQQLFLLGVDWLRKEKGTINFEREELRLKRDSDYERIPIKFVEHDEYEDEYEEEYEEEFEDREILSY
jgi:hypothetical protein